MIAVMRTKEVGVLLENMIRKESKSVASTSLATSFGLFLREAGQLIYHYSNQNCHVFLSFLSSISWGHSALSFSSCVVATKLLPNHQ